MAYDQATKDAVRASYVFKHLTLEHAAQEHGVGYNTVRRWKRDSEGAGDCWDRARNAARLADGGLGNLSNVMLTEFAMQAESIMHSMQKDKKMSATEKVSLMAKLSDSYAKTVAAVGKSDKQVSALAVAMKVITLLSDFIEKNYPDYRVVFIDEILEPVGRYVAEELE